MQISVKSICPYFIKVFHGYAISLLLMSLQFNPYKVIPRERLEKLFPSHELNVGKVSQLSPKNTEKLLYEWTQQIDTYSQKVARFSAVYIRLFEQRFITFEEYQQLFIRIDEAEYEFFPAYEYFMILDKTQLSAFIADKKPTYESYWQTLQSEIRKGHLTGLQQLFSEFSATISLQSLTRHVYINGSTGSGKSELLKSLLYQVATKFDSGVVLIDPHGDLSIQLALLLQEICPDRLVYFDPFLKAKEDRFPVLNPLDIKLQTAQERDTYAKHLTSAFCELLPNELSVNMKTLLEPCFSVLLQKEDATLVDVQKLIKGDPSLLAFARANAEHHRLFFENFKDGLYASTKSAIFTKLQSLLNSRTFYHITCQNEGFQLSQALKEKKIILFNLDKGQFGEEQAQAFGKLLLAQIKNHVMQQSINQRQQLFLAIDEAHNFVSHSMESIIVEARKYQLSLWLCTQLSKQLGSLEDTVLANVGTIFTGNNRAKDTLYKVASVSSCPITVLESLRDFEFWVEQKSGGRFSFLVDNSLVKVKKSWENIGLLKISFYKKTKSFKDVKTEKPKFGI